MAQHTREQGWRDLVSGRRRGAMAALARLGLNLLSFPYGLAVGIRNLAYDRGWARSERVAVPVVSVGNLTLGGTGKTPAVEYLARWFRARDKRVAILSRGYGADAGRNDEALVLEENLPDVPHLQGADRAALARLAQEELESEVLLLDDGFQHRRLARDLDLVLLDATNPWGHGRLFPRGLLRETPHGLRRAGAVLITRCDLAAASALERLRAEIARWNRSVPILASRHAPQELINAERQTAPFSMLAGRPVAALCGIGNPEAFHAMLASLGARVMAQEWFPDHHRYTRDDVERLRRWADGLGPEALVVTTQKDLVKLRLARLGERPLWAVRIALEITAGRDDLDRLLMGVCA